MACFSCDGGMYQTPDETPNPETVESKKLCHRCLVFWIVVGLLFVLTVFHHHDAEGGYVFGS